MVQKDIYKGYYTIELDEPLDVDDYAIAITYSKGALNSYSEVNPIQPGYVDRRDIYNLYHLLNHLNLFGGMYLYEVLRVVERYR